MFRAVPVSAADRALVDLATMEAGGAVPLRTSAGGADITAELLAAGLIEPDGKRGPFRLTPAGRARAGQVRQMIQAGGIGASPLRAVR